MTPMTAAAMGAVPVAKAGVGSGVLNTFRQVGGALGIAVLGAILTSRSRAPSRPAPPPEAFIDGFQLALLVAAVFAFAGALTAALLVRRVRMSSPLRRARRSCELGAEPKPAQRVRLAAAERRADLLEAPSAPSPRGATGV